MGLYSQIYERDVTGNDSYQVYIHGYTYIYIHTHAYLLVCFSQLIHVPTRHRIDGMKSLHAAQGIMWVCPLV